MAGLRLLDDTDTQIDVQESVHTDAQHMAKAQLGHAGACARLQVSHGQQLVSHKGRNVMEFPGFSVRNKGRVNAKYADGKDMQYDEVIVTDGEVGLVHQAPEGGRA
jgi:hypothetical protein